jgi:hypothetical protein
MLTQASPLYSYPSPEISADGLMPQISWLIIIIIIIIIICLTPIEPIKSYKGVSNEAMYRRNPLGRKPVSSLLLSGMRGTE